MEKKVKNRKKNIWRKLIKWISLTLGLIVLLIIITVVFFTDDFLKLLIEDFVYYESRKVYKIELKDIDYDITSNTLNIYDVKLIPDTVRYNELTNEGDMKSPLYEFYVEDFSIEKMRFLTLYFNNELIIDKILVKNPRLEQIGKKITKEKKPHKRFTAEIKRISTKYLNKFSVKEIVLSDGIFDFYRDIKDTLMATNFQGISLYLKDFIIQRKGSCEKDQRVLFSKDLEFKVENIKTDIKDTKHIMGIDSIIVSSIKNEIAVNGIVLNSGNDENLVANNIKIPEILFKGTEIFRLIFDSYLFCDSILILTPEIRIKGSNNKKEKTPNLNTINKESLYALISDRVKGIAINDIYVKKGMFEKTNDNNDNKPSFKVSEFDFILEGITLDSSNIKEKQKLIIADNANINVQDMKIETGKNGSKILIPAMSLNTFVSSIIIDSANLMMQSEDNGMSNILVPGLSIKGINFTNLSFLSDLHLNKVLLKDPYFNISSKKNDKNKDVKTDNKAIISLPVLIDSLEIINGKYNMAYSDVMKGENTYDINCPDFDLDVNYLKFNPAYSGTDSMIMISGLEVKLNNLIANDRKENQFLKSEMLYLSTYDSLLDLNKPQVRICDRCDKDTLQSQSTSAYFNMDRLSVEGVNLLDIYYLKDIVAKKVTFKNPVLKIDDYYEGNDSTGELTHSFIRQKFSNTLKNIRFDHINMENANIDLNREINDGIASILRDTFSIDFFGFDISDNTEETDNLFFSDSINVNIRDYVLDYTRIHHKISIEAFYLKTGSKSTSLYGFDMIPDKNANINSSYSIYLPVLKIADLDFKKLFFNNDLSLGSINFYNPDITILNVKNDKHKSNDSLVFKISNPGFINNTTIKTIGLNNGKIKLQTIKDTSRSTLLAGSFDIHAENILMDSATTFRLFNDTLFTNDIDINFHKIYGDVNNIYSYQTDDVDISIRDKNARISGLLIKPILADINDSVMKTIEKKSIYNISLSDLKIEEINYQDFFSGKGINIGSFEVDTSDITVYNRKKEKSVIKNTNHKLDLTLPSNIDKLFIEQMNFKNIKMLLHQFSDNKSNNFNINEISGYVENFLLDSTYKSDNRFLFSDDIRLTSNGYAFYSEDSMYCFTIGKINLTTGEKSISIDSLQLEPQYPKYKFAKAKGYQTDRMDLSVDRLYFSGIDFNTILKKDKFISDKLTLNGFYLNAFRDKSMPFPEWQKRKMPQDMIKSIPLLVDIDTVQIKNGYINYGERLKENLKDGEVYLSVFRGYLYGLTNDTLAGKNLRVETYFDIMGEGKTKAYLDMPLNTVNDTFHFYGNIAKMDLSEFNPMTKNLFGVAIKRGYGRLTYVQMYGNKNFVTGQMLFPYRRFKIQLIDRFTGKKGGIGDGILSFLANEILLKSNNPKFGSKVRVGEIYCKRDPRKAIFNFIWKGVLSGIESTLGYNKREQRKEFRQYKKKKRELRRNKNK